MAFYPSALPDPLNGSSFKTHEHRLITDGDIAPRSRLLNPNYRQIWSLTWTLTEKQFRVFEAWYRLRLHDGVSRFDVQWCNGAGQARFTAPVQASLNGNTWSLSSEVEIDYAISSVN